MKRNFKGVLSLLLAAVMIFSSVAVGLTNIELPDFGTLFAQKAEAAETYTEGYYTYTVDENGNATITDVDTLISGDVTIPSTLGGYPVTGFDVDFNYSYVYNIYSITIPKGITNIGQQTFNNLDFLKSIIVDSLNPVYSNDEYGVLYNKDKSQIINYPQGNERKFYSIPESVKIIGKCSFMNCLNLETITIGESVTEIKDSAFQNCANIKNIIIPDNVINIRAFAFSFCGSLKSITISDSLTSIERWAFEGCDNLTDIYYSGTKEKWNKIAIGDYNEALIGANIYFAERECYIDGYYTYTVDENGNATITDVDESISGDITIPSTLGGYPVRSIGDYAFSDCIGLTRVIIPEGVTSVCFHSFSNCSSIKEILLPDGLQTIESGAFGGCTNLESINIPKSVTRITGSDFTCYTIFSGTKLYNNPQNWTDDILYIDDCLIYSKNKNAKIEIREGTRLISGSAFIYSDASEIVIPDSVEIINNTAFYVCNNLMRITIPQSVREIGNHAIGYTDNYFTRSDMGPDYDKIPEFIIYCYKNTEGMNYAIENEFDYRIVGETYTLTLDANGGEFSDGSTVFTAEVECGADLYDIIPGAPIMEGYTFRGWNGTLPSKMPEHDITLKANYDINIYQITFNTNGGTVISPIRLEYGASVPSPANPTKDGYVFAGWTDEHGNPASIPATMPAHDIILYASWEEIVPETYTVTWVVDGVSRTENYEVGATITAPADPVKTGYTFAGWTPDVPDIMPAHDLVFTAVWEKVPEENLYNLGEETYSFANYPDGDKEGHGGHCFGMSVTSSGYYMGILDMMEWTGATDGMDVYDLTLTPKVHEPICLFQYIQGPFYLNSIVAGGTYDKTYDEETDTGTIDIEYDWNDVTEYSKSHKYDGAGNLVVGLVGTVTDSETGKEYKGGHAVNFIRYEEVNGQPRIYIYDSNIPFMETYLYKDSYGNIKQAPYSTFDVSIDCVALQDINIYFEIVSNFLESQYIYAKSNSVRVEGAKAYLMKGSVETEGMVMYEIPEGVEKVNIIPLKENASIIYLDKEYSFGEIDSDTVGVFTLSSTDDSVGGNNTPGLEIINEPDDIPEITSEIRRPSTTTISYGDSIILHADINAELPAGYTVKWTADNSNFSYKANGATCEISPEKSGDTTFTATIYDADGNPVSTDEQTMTSKAGFFQKIIAFFKKLFGLTKTIPNVFKS